MRHPEYGILKRNAVRHPTLQNVPREHTMRTLVRLLPLLALTLPAGAYEIPPDKEIIYFEHSKLGTVTFLHKMHSELRDVDCRFCHHTDKGTGKPEPCHRCHKGEPQDETPKRIKAFHTRCRGCHQYTVDAGKKAGPVKKCTLCHIKPGQGGAEERATEQ